jgi:O-antigen/teichoic acid export membrane protein
MERSARFTFGKNAFANVSRASSSALLALVVPPFLTRALSPEKYGAWALALQLAAYVGYLEFGIQTAVGRFIAHANERSDFEHRNRIVSTALALLSGACVLALMLIAGLAAVLPKLFKQMPGPLYHDVRVALVLVGGSLALGLPASVFGGIFAGLQRYEIPAVIVAGSRIFSSILLIGIARHGGQITAMALCVAVVNLLSYLLQWLAYRRYASNILLSVRSVAPGAVRELVGYCTSLTVWSFGMLLISGLDLTLVGMLDFPRLAFYAIAATAVMFVAGLQNAVFTAMVPSTAVLHARRDAKRLGQVVLEGTRYGMLLLLLTGIPLLLWARPILQIWVGPVYALRTSALLQVLVVGNMVRLSAVPYVATLIGTGQQRLVILTPLLEGATNLSISVVAGYRWGAAGVAFGTLCGAIVGAGGNLFYNMPRTLEVRFSIREYVVKSLLFPILCALPLATAFFLQSTLSGFPSSARVLTIFVGGALSGCLLWPLLVSVRGSSAPTGPSIL